MHACKNFKFPMSTESTNIVESGEIQEKVCDCCKIINSDFNTLAMERNLFVLSTLIILDTGRAPWQRQHFI